MNSATVPKQRRTHSWIDSWGIPVGLILLGVVPVVMGTIRLGDIASGATIYAPYFPVVVHIASVTVYCLVGALQFSKKARQTNHDYTD